MSLTPPNTPSDCNCDKSACRGEGVDPPCKDFQIAMEIFFSSERRVEQSVFRRRNNFKVAWGVRDIATSGLRLPDWQLNRGGGNIHVMYVM